MAIKARKPMRHGSGGAIPLPTRIEHVAIDRPAASSRRDGVRGQSDHWS